MVASNPNLLYPNRHQLVNVYSEGSSPHLYNYFVYHGFQVFMHRTKKTYKVWARGWIPRKYVEEYKYSSGDVDYILCYSLKIKVALDYFRSAVLELIGSHKYGQYFEDNPLVEVPDVVPVS